MKSIKLASENQEYTNGVSVSYIYTYTGTKPEALGSMSAYVQHLAVAEGYTVSDKGVIDLSEAKHRAIPGTYSGYLYSVAGVITASNVHGHNVSIPVLIKYTQADLVESDEQALFDLCYQAVSGLFEDCFAESRPPVYTQRKRLTKTISTKDTNLLDHTFCVCVRY